MRRHYQAPDGTRIPKGFHRFGGISLQDFLRGERRKDASARAHAGLDGFGDDLAERAWVQRKQGEGDNNG